MAHLVIGEYTSRTAIVKLYLDERKQLREASDPFEKAEIRSYIATIEDWILSKGGRNYLDGIRAEVEQAERATIREDKRTLHQKKLVELIKAGRYAEASQMMLEVI